MAIGTAAAIIGGSLIGAGGSVAASRSASNASRDAANASNAELARQYDLGRQDLAPYRGVGGQALNSLAAEMGLAPYTPPVPTVLGRGGGFVGNSPVSNLVAGMLNRSPVQPGISPESRYAYADTVLPGGVPPGAAGSGVAPGGAPAGSGIGRFQTSPGYQFVRDEGARGLERSAAARGGAFSGNALRGLDEFNSGLASQEYGNWWNRMAGLAGIGQTATNTGVNLGQNYANNYGANTMAAGNARASGILSGWSGVGNAINSGLNNYMLYQGGYFNRPPASNTTIPGGY